MENKKQEDYLNIPQSPQGSDEQQMSPEVSALSRTPTPASICPVSSPIQRPIRIHHQRSHRKFLLAIPAITVLAVAAVVLFYAITWNDSPPSNRSDDVQQINKDESSKRAQGRMSDYDDLQGPSQRAAKNKPKDEDFSSNRDNVIDARDKPDDSLLQGREGSNWNSFAEVKKVATTTEEVLDPFGSIPWPTYGDMNFTDEDLYSEEMLFKVDKLMSRRKTKHPFFIDLVETQLNYSDANNYCKSRNGYLMLLFNIQEEVYFSKVLAHSEVFNSKCKNGFIGFRKIMEEDIKIKGFKIGSFADPLSSRSEIWITNDRGEKPRGDCVALYHNDSSNTFGLIRKSCESKLSCYLCETARGCPAPSCYFWHYKMNTTVTYDEAKQLCISEKEGTLARIQNKVTLNLVKEALNVSTKNSIFNLYSEEACSQGYFVEKDQLDIGQFGFENADEQQILYKSPAIMLAKQDMAEGLYCLAVFNDRAFKWLPVPCPDKNCFFCRYDRLR